jgi:hypothetical protein
MLEAQPAIFVEVIKNTSNLQVLEGAEISTESLRNHIEERPACQTAGWKNDSENAESGRD